jgi:hypothetical protein
VFNLASAAGNHGWRRLIISWDQNDVVCPSAHGDLAKVAERGTGALVIQAFKTAEVIVISEQPDLLISRRPSYFRRGN